MLRLLFRAWFLLLALVLLPQAMAANVALVLSDNGGPYAEFATSFGEYSSKSHWKISYTGKIEGLSSAPLRPDLMIAVGSEAFRAALALGTNTPILATLIPRHSYDTILAESGRSRPRGTTSAIVLDQPAQRLGAFIRHLLPTYQNVGLLSSDETRNQLPYLKASFAGLNIDSEEVSGDPALLGAINALLPRVNLLLALPDSKIYKRENIKSILVTTFRHQRPLIAFSKAFVTAGALAAIYSTPAQLARQSAELLLAMPAGSAALPAIQMPGQFAISVNSNVAQSLNLDLPDEASLRRAMQLDGASK
jgi:putative ABC transport system substrate-binding protein